MCEILFDDNFKIGRLLIHVKENDVGDHDEQILFSEHIVLISGRNLISFSLMDQLYDLAADDVYLLVVLHLVSFPNQSLIIILVN
jgi:hypothetical protein